MQFAKPDKLDALKLHQDHWCNCVSCPLGTTLRTRSKVVLWRGYIPCDILFLGEAPGRDEDVDGYPFVGVSGRLQDDLIADTIAGLKKDGEYVDNVVAFTNTNCCLPLEAGEFRPPTEEEAEACNPRLQEFLKIAEPTVIVLVGNVAKATINRIPETIVTFSMEHPSFLLRQPKHDFAQLYLKHLTILRQAWQATIPF